MAPLFSNFLPIFCICATLFETIESISSSRTKVITWKDDEDIFPNTSEAKDEDIIQFDKEVDETDLEELDMRKGFGRRNEPSPDIHLTTPQLIEQHGFPAEVHYVTTEDGYILTLHRIPHGKTINESQESRPVVFLQHGMFGTSADWILNSEYKSLGYMLAQAGYDVWLGNCRGNKYSQAHTTIPTSHIKFWRFSWHEMGRYDLPAVLDYVLNVTGKSNLSYIGHSMGTTMFFVLLSTRPEYNSKINFMGALGPAVFLNHGTGPAKYLAKFYGRAERLVLDIIGHGVFLPKFVVKTLQFLGPEFCTEAMKIDKLCEEAMFLLAGHDPAQTNYTRLPVIVAHVPSTVSTQTGFHYFQIIKSGKFSMYDHGRWNSRIYGTSSPPNYDLLKG